MDITVYDKRIQKLASEYEAAKQMLDMKTIRILHRMRKYALETGDDKLLGYVYHSLAFSYYFIAGDYPAFLKYIRQATTALIRAKDEAELLHVFYLIAIDALNRGMSDIAYDYFLIARMLAKRYGNPVSAAILDENIGHVLLGLHAFEESRVFSGRCLKELRKHREHPHYVSNMLAGYLNDGAACLALGKRAEAQKRFHTALKFADRHADEAPAGSLFELYLFGARVALANGRWAGMRRSLEKMYAQTTHITQIMTFADSIRILCEELTAKKMLDEVLPLIRLMEKYTPAEEALSIKSILVDIKVDYYTAIGNTRKLNRCYEEQDQIYRQLRSEQKKADRYAGDLITLIGSLREEQRRISREHDALLRQSVTDALTDLPNRRALNTHLEKVFERAYKEGTHFGIGILDVDDLKKINDTYGHASGDECLVGIGNALRLVQAKHPVFCARYGGDEFVMVFDNMTSPAIREVCGTVRKLCGAKLSIGVCNESPKKKNRSWDYFSCADRALYRAKECKNARGNAHPVRFEKLRLMDAVNRS